MFSDVARVFLGSDERTAWTERGTWYAALTAPRSRSTMVSALCGALVLSAILHIVIIRATSGAFPDMEAYGIQAQAFFHSQNVYAVTSRYPYPPVWIWIVAAARWCANTFGLPFADIVRLPGTCADLIMGAALFAYARRRFGFCLLTLGTALLYLLNPVALLISAAHGQFDALVMVFVLLALCAKGSQHDRWGVTSGVLLGVAIALKGFPVMLLPYFVRAATPGKRVGTAISACVPVVVSVAIYVAIFGYTPLMYAHIVAYRSTADLGWLYLLLHLPLLGTSIVTHSATFAPVLVLILFGSEIFVLVFAITVPGKRLVGQPATAIALIFAVLYATTATMSVQYIVWILPFLCIAAPLEVLPYSLVACAAAITFYTQAPGVSGVIPDVAPGAYWLHSAPAIRFISATALLLYSAIIARRLLRRSSSAKPPYHAQDADVASVVPNALTWSRQ